MFSRGTAGSANRMAQTTGTVDGDAKWHVGRRQPRQPRLTAVGHKAMGVYGYSIADWPRKISALTRRRTGEILAGQTLVLEGEEHTGLPTKKKQHHSRRFCIPLKPAQHSVDETTRRNGLHEQTDIAPHGYRRKRFGIASFKLNPLVSVGRRITPTCQDSSLPRSGACAVRLVKFNPMRFVGLTLLTW